MSNGIEVSQDVTNPTAMGNGLYSQRYIILAFVDTTYNNNHFYRVSQKSVPCVNGNNS